MRDAIRAINVYNSPNVTSLRCQVRCDSPERLGHEWILYPCPGIYILDQMRGMMRGPSNYQIILFCRLNTTQLCFVL